MKKGDRARVAKAINDLNQPAGQPGSEIRQIDNNKPLSRRNNHEQ